MDDHSPSRENFLDVLLETRKRIDASAKRDELANDGRIVDARHGSVVHVPQCATEDGSTVTVQGLRRCGRRASRKEVAVNSISGNAWSSRPRAESRYDSAPPTRPPRFMVFAR